MLDIPFLGVVVTEQFCHAHSATDVHDGTVPSQASKGLTNCKFIFLHEQKSIHCKGLINLQPGTTVRYHSSWMNDVYMCVFINTRTPVSIARASPLKKMYRNVSGPSMEIGTRHMWGCPASSGSSDSLLHSSSILVYRGYRSMFGVWGRTTMYESHWWWGKLRQPGVVSLGVQDNQVWSPLWDVGVGHRYESILKKWTSKFDAVWGAGRPGQGFKWGGLWGAEPPQFFWGGLKRGLYFRASKVKVGVLKF